jgi:GH15 family glucan-1,4-alpha-glucosidase
MGARIEDYGLIGNMLSAALVSREGSVDWLCLPRFDSPACFAALLGTAEHGRWQIAPAGPHRTSRRYVPGTAVLETRFDTEEGSVAVIDFMPFSEEEEKIDLVRIVRGLSGRVAMRMELILRFNYGQAVPWVRRRDYGLSAIAGPDAVELHTQAPLRGVGLTAVAEFGSARARACPSPSPTTARTRARISSPTARTR